MEAVDDDNVLVVEDAAPASLYDYACRQDGRDEVLRASEAESVQVKFAVREVQEETAFYLWQTPPSNSYVDIGCL